MVNKTIEMFFPVCASLLETSLVTVSPSLLLPSLHLFLSPALVPHPLTSWEGSWVGGSQFLQRRREDTHPAPDPQRRKCTTL